MAVQKWGAAETPIVVFSTGLAGLASAAKLAATATSGVMTSGVIPNATDRYTHMAVDLNLVHATAVWSAAPNGFFGIYAIPNITGTLPDGTSTADPTSDLLIGSLSVRGATATSVHVAISEVGIPPFDFTLVLRNQTGQAVASGLTTQTFTVARYNLTVV